MLGVKLNEPEPVSPVELDFLICVKHFQILSKISFVIIQKLFVDIQTLIIKKSVAFGVISAALVYFYRKELANSLAQNLRPL